jgi:hypothetical protein
MEIGQIMIYQISNCVLDTTARGKFGYVETVEAKIF